MILTQEAWEEVIRFQMQTWNNEKVNIINSTVIAEVISENDGFDPAVSSAKQFPLSIDWTVWANGGKPFTWPENWLTMTVTDLAEYIIKTQKDEEDSGIIDNDNL